MKTLLIIITSLVAFNVQADFTFECKESSTEACMEWINSLPLSTFRCNINSETLSCRDASDGPLESDNLNCKVRSPECSEVDDFVNFSYPPQYTCKQGKDWQPQVHKNRNGGYVGLFCTKKITPPPQNPAAQHKAGCPILAQMRCEAGSKVAYVRDENDCPKQVCVQAPENLDSDSSR